MMRLTLNKTISLWVGACCILFGGHAAAQSYPDRPMRIIVPNSAGGGTDAFARIVAQKLGEAWGQTVVVDNKPGAQGNLGTALGAKAAPDGYTLTLAYTSAFAVSPYIYKDAGFDPLKDFTAVAMGVTQPYLVVTQPASKFNTLKEMAAQAKAKPDSMTYASTSSQTELIGQLFMMLTDTRMVYIPYKSATTAVVDLARGEVDVMYASLPSAIPFVQAGKLKGIALTGDKRVAALPDVPTAIEAGYPDFDAAGWYGIVAPTGTPSDIVNKLNKQINLILEMPDVKEALAAGGFETAPMSVQAFADLIQRDYQRWGKVVKAAKEMRP
jgi:tripartite-type tricarboxylate transporter receptor subunit TctC